MVNDDVAKINPNQVFGPFLEARMTTLTNNDERVKSFTFADGYLHIDLRDGLRLSGPLQAAERDAPSRSRLSETPPSFWDDLDDGLAS